MSRARQVVVYYVPQNRLDGEDFVGGVVSTISASMPPNTAVEEFGPFYSRIAPGIARAEDPTAFLQAFADLSFSQTRIQAVTSVIKTNDGHSPLNMDPSEGGCPHSNSGRAIRDSHPTAVNGTGEGLSPKLHEQLIRGWVGWPDRPWSDLHASRGRPIYATLRT